MAKASEDQIKNIGLDAIDGPAGSIRLDISEEGIRELAGSISEIGQLQAILLRPAGDRYEVVFGHRRVLAVRSLGWERIHAVVKELDDIQVAVMRATENIVSERLTPIEEGAVYLDLQDTHKLTLDDIAKRMRKSVGVIKRRMDLLKMPPCLQKAIHSGQINYGVAEELWSLGDLGKIEYFLAFAVEHGATVMVVRGWVQDEKKKMRLSKGDIDGGSSLQNPMESRPVYVACDLCLGSMVLGEEAVIRACKACVKAMREANIIE